MTEGTPEKGRSMGGIRTYETGADREHLTRVFGGRRVTTRLLDEGRRTDFRCLFVPSISDPHEVPT